MVNASPYRWAVSVIGRAAPLSVVELSRRVGLSTPNGEELASDGDAACDDGWLVIRNHRQGPSGIGEHAPDGGHVNRVIR